MMCKHGRLRQSVLICYLLVCISVACSCWRRRRIVERSPLRTPAHRSLTASLKMCFNWKRKLPVSIDDALAGNRWRALLI